MKRFHLLVAASLSALCVSATAQPPKEPSAQAAALSPRSFGSWGVDLSARDLATKPGTSFFDHVNGGWYESAVIPADRPATGVTVELIDLAQRQLRAVIEDSAAAPSSEAARRVGSLYQAFMNETQLEKADSAPLLADLESLKAVRDKSGMARQFGASVGTFGTSLFGFGVGPDKKQPDIYSASLGIGGMLLPDRDYYLTDKFKAQRDAYPEYVARTLKLIGWPDSEAAGAAVLALETRIAEATWPLAEQRDENKMYRPMTLDELIAAAPDFDWKAYFAGLGMPGVKRLIVGQSTAVPKVARIFAETPLETLKAWQAFHMTNEASSYLSKRFVDNAFAFSRTLSGQPQLPPRWQRGVGLVNGVLGESVGQEYVRRHFPASSKKMMEELVANLQDAMRKRIEGAAWMSPETRAAALKKLAMQRVKVGYPDKWRDYSGLEIDPGDLYASLKRAQRFHARYYFDRLGKKVDRDEWLMTPQTVNAYFNPTGNEIVFPAAMLQPPMFDPKADPAVNYGAIGSVIGHEITHGFDDQGRQFDEVGALRDWWSPADSARFNSEAAKLVEQYGAFEGMPGMKVNGKLTLGENLGDYGGVRIALDAYHSSLNGRPADVKDGLTGDQRFFLAYAQGWRNKLRDDLKRMLLVSDVHSPLRWRVDGTLRHIDEWYSAFGVKVGEPMYLKPEERVRIW